MEKLDMYETYFPILISTNISMGLEVFIERVYADHSEYILKIIESGEVTRENIEYFQKLDFSKVDKNSLLHIFKFRALANKIDLSVYKKIFYYLGILIYASKRYCEIFLNQNTNIKQNYA
jgi:hypothetical protein